MEPARNLAIYRPIDENGFSDAVTLYLRHHLAGEGIFANREVEVVRHPGDPVGQRTDILINTLRHTESGDPLDPISAVIEVKGCWNAELFTALETQLVQGYMVQLGPPSVSISSAGSSHRSGIPRMAVEVAFRRRRYTR